MPKPQYIPKIANRPYAPMTYATQHRAGNGARFGAMIICGQFAANRSVEP